MKKIELPMEEIIKKYEKGITTLNLSKEYGIPQGTIKMEIIKYLQATPGKPEFTRIDLPIEKIINEYEEGTSQLQLAKKYSVSLPTISSRILEYYSRTGKPKPKRKHIKETTYKRIELPVEKIVNEYEEGTSQVQLAKKYGVSPRTISCRINEYYQIAGKEKPQIQKKELLIEEIVKKYEEGISESELAKEYGISQNIISQKTKEYYARNGKVKPKRLKSSIAIIQYLNKGLTIEQITEIATKKNIIIPKEIIDMALSKVDNRNLTDDNEER